MNRWFPLFFVLVIAFALGAFMGPIFAAQEWNLLNSPWMIGIAMWSIINTGLVLITGLYIAEWLADRC